MPDPTLRLKYYQETGQTDQAKLYEQYLRETGQMQEERRPTVPGVAADATRALSSSRPDAGGDFEATAPAVLGTLASPIRHIPGAEATAAAVRSVVRRQPYAQARNDIRDAVDEAPKSLTVPLGVGGAVVSGLALPGNAIRQGFMYGAGSALGSSDPDMDLKGRIDAAGVEGAAGGVLGAAGMAAGAIKNLPPGVFGKVGGAIMPKFVQRGVRAYNQVRQAATAAVPAAESAAAEAAAPQAEGFVGNGMGNLTDAADAVASRPRSIISPRHSPSSAELIERTVAPNPPSGTTEGFVGNGLDNLADAAEAAGAHSQVQSVPRSKPSLAEIIERTVAPPSPPANAEGFVGNGMDNVIEAVKANEAQGADLGSKLPDVVKATERYRTASGALQRRGTDARFAHFADQFAQRQAAQQEAAAAEPSLEDQLAGTLQLIKSGGTLGALRRP